MALLDDLTLHAVKHTKLFCRGQTGFVCNTQHHFPLQFLGTHGKQKDKRFKILSHCQFIMCNEGKTKHMSSRNVNEMLQRKTKPTACCILLLTDWLSAYCPLWTIIWQLHSHLCEDQLLSSGSVISHNEWERLQQESLGGMDAQDGINLTASSCTGWRHVFW